MLLVFCLLLVFTVGGRCAELSDIVSGPQKQKIIFKLDGNKTSTGRSTSRWYEIHFSTIIPLSDAILPMEPIKVTTGFILIPTEVIISKPLIKTKTATSPPKRTSKSKISDARRLGIPSRVRKMSSKIPVGGPDRVHKVKTGDTLLSLSKQYYNNPKQWIKIYRANKEKIIKGILKPGVVLIIP